MKNHIAGCMIVGVAVVIAFIVYMFNRALTKIVNTACTHGPECPMWGTISFHTNVSIGITVVIALIGVYLIFFGAEEKIITKVVRQKPPQPKEEKRGFPAVLAKLNAEERQLFQIVIDAKGSIFQSELVEKTGLSKVKVTRLLDRLEGRGIIERKRRGMTNMIVLKH